MNKIKKELFIISILIVLDQILKIVAIQNNNLVLIDGILKINVFDNTKGAYGINSNSTIMYVLTNIIVIVIGFQFITSQNQFVNNKMKIVISLIIAGGISNCIDRIFRKFVVEYIDFTSLINLPIFNLADIYILIGWVALAAIFAAFTVKEIKDRKSTKKEG